MSVPSPPSKVPAGEGGGVADGVGGLLLVEAEQVAGGDGGAERAVGRAGAEALLVAPAG